MACYARRRCMKATLRVRICQQRRVAAAVDKIDLRAAKTVVLPLGSLESDGGGRLIAIVRRIFACHAIARRKLPTFIPGAPPGRLARLVVDVLERRPKPVREILGGNMQCRQAVDFRVGTGPDLDPVIPRLVGGRYLAPLSFDFLGLKRELDRSSAAREQPYLVIGVVQLLSSDELIGGLIQPRLVPSRPRHWFVETLQRLVGFLHNALANQLL